VFYHVAGDDPFGQFRRVVGAGVGHDGVQNVQGDAGIVDGFANAKGGHAFFATTRTLGLDGGFKVANVLVQVGNEGVRQLEADELGLKRHGVGGKGAGGVEQFLVAVMAWHVELAVQSGDAEQDEGMGGLADAEEIVVEFQAQGHLVQNARVGSFAAGNLSRAESGGGSDGGLDEGELLCADAGGGKVRSVFVALGVGGFEGGKK